MKYILVAMALTTVPDVRPVPAQGYRPLTPEQAWRMRHPEIPGYVPYTPGYGPYIENGVPRFEGTPNRSYREEYPRIDYPRVLRCWRDQAGRCVR